MSKNNITTEIDSRLHRILLCVFRRHKIPAFGMGIITYAVLVILLKDITGVSSNFFVIIPLLFTANIFGLWGGFFAGAAALPVNILMFKLLNCPEYLPESLILSEIAGIALGIIMGYFSDSFVRMIKETEKRKTAEKNLLEVLKEKDLLLNEIHHRIKNNLNLIKSLMQLQMNRTDNESFLLESRKLMQRIYSIAEIHQQLFNHGYSSYIDLQKYVESLLKHIHQTSGDPTLDIKTDMDDQLLPLSMKQATPLGLIINEIFTNIIKYALPEMTQKEILVSFYKTSELYQLTISYQGPVFNPEGKTNGLGLKLIKNLTKQLDGNCRFSFNEKCCFFLEYPEKEEKT